MVVVTIHECTFVSVLIVLPTLSFYLILANVYRANDTDKYILKRYCLSLLVISLFVLVL